MVVRAASVLTVGLAAYGLVAAAQQPTFKTNITHVLVDVVVTDKHDQQVTDLTADEFVIREEGREQKIADFERILVPLGNREVDLTATPAPPPDTFSNAKPPHTARAFVFIMDNCSLDTDNIVVIKRVMAEFLRTLTPDDRVAIIYVSRSDMGQDFTNDTGRLAAAVNNLPAVLGAPCPRGSKELVLESAADTLAASRETRRAVILVSGFYGRSVPPSEMYDAVQHVRHRGMPIYAIDPRGLMAPPLGLQGHMEDQTPERRMASQHAVFSAQQALIELAEETGGLAFVNNSNLNLAIHDLMSDNGSYYLLGYYPTPYVADGKFHDIDVTVTRPGLKVRARAGYMTAKPRPASAPPPRLVESLTEGVPGGELELHAFAAPVSATKTGARALLTFDVTYPASDGGRPRVDDQLQLTWLALGPDAEIKASGESTITIPLATSSRDAFTLSVNDSMDLPKGHLTLRMAVASRLLGTQGTVHVPIDVPAFTGAKLDASPLVLGLEGGPLVRLATIGAGLGDVPFQPTPTRTFTLGRQLRVFFRVFASTMSDVKTATLVLKQGEAVIKTLPIAATPSKAPANALDCEASVALRGLAKGTYAIEFTVERAGQKPVQRALTFEVK